MVRLQFQDFLIEELTSDLPTDFKALFNTKHFASTAGGLRNRTAAAFSPLKKFASHFFNHAFSVTGEKEAANPVTVEEIQPIIRSLNNFI